MTPTGPPRQGATRFTETGDIEIFDGESWYPVASLLAEAAVGDRDDKQTQALADPELSADG